MLDTDTDRLLPHLFELCVKGGRSSRSRVDAADFAGYRQRLVDGGGVVGFDSRNDQALLDGWLRSCVVEMGTVGRSRSGEQMLGVAPLTLAAYRAGLPTRRERHRGIDEVVYSLLVDELRRRGVDNPPAQLRSIIIRTVGRGLSVGPEPRWEPHLEDADNLDIGALLELRFVEGIEMGDARQRGDLLADSPLPAVSAALGRTLLSHVTTYGERLAVPALMSGFAALLALGVLGFSLRVDRAARQLLDSGALPPDMLEDAPSRLELYCDFTGDRGGESARLSRRCVERDLDRARLAFRDRVTFGLVENALARLPAEQERHRAAARPQQLELLAELRDHRRVQSWAEGRIDDLVAEAEMAGSTTTETERDFLTYIQAGFGSEVDKLLDVLEFVNQERATKNSVAWFRSVGGIAKPYGLLEGTPRSRRSWRYAPGDDLLTALLLAVFVRPDRDEPRPAMPLREVIDALRDRFGLLIERPPEFLDGAEARAAAAANLEAFKRRLQLLGCFDGLSDDFSVQVVRHPLGDS
ncbi:hypothetical protein ACFPEL_00505 [Actinomycetospora chibensis]|uniref:Uncharacterized protein n=2 Tax=Actinomycetospora chibensis TaxID=663606 RepID=A0ABV9RAV6_9PSEU|nr:hypothetical protein [Actinomycetospora chibensis]MDD7924213.1 hypothetical protein [Actinomycetospora chibensis]